MQPSGGTRSAWPARTRDARTPGPRERARDRGRARCTRRRRRRGRSPAAWWQHGRVSTPGYYDGETWPFLPGRRARVARSLGMDQRSTSSPSASRTSRAPAPSTSSSAGRSTFTDGDIVMFQAGPMIVSLWGRAQLADDSGVAAGRRLGRLHPRLRGWGPHEVDAVCAQARPARPHRAPARSRSATPGCSPIPTATRGRSPGSRRLALHDDGTVALRHDLGRAAGAASTCPARPRLPVRADRSRSSRRRTARCSRSPPRSPHRSTSA